jgi:outer membrane receptor protein involved in Fe transport
MYTKYPRLRNLRPLLTLVGASITTGLVAQTTPPPNLDKTTTSATTSQDDEVYYLSPFEVTTDRDVGYVATQTLAGTRIRTDLGDVASSISVVTKDFMNDIGATDSGTLLQYTANAEVAGTSGTYTGLGSNQTLYDGTKITTNNRLRGLDSADTTRDYFLSSIPWDSYNIDRVDIQRGPNAILFGLGSPAGIVNAGMHNAQYTNMGSVETRYGSFGSLRGSIDVNRQIIDNVLAVRVDGLWNNTKYQQKPAFKDDQRIYGTIRWDPKIFSPDFATSVKMKFESGKIKANMPRTTTPYDNITSWFTDANKATVGGSSATYSVYDLGSSASSANAWFSTQLGQQYVGYITNGVTGNIDKVIGGYINNGFLNADGSVRGVGENGVGQRYSEQFYGLSSYSNYAKYAKLPYYMYAQYKDKMLTDSSVFNFYDNLIDGDNKREYANWQTYNLDISQSGWGDRVGLNLTYNREKYNTKDWSLLGSAPAINIDLTSVLQDGSTNSNYGRPFITASSGGSGNWSTTERDTLRGSVFGELRASDFMQNELLVKLIGKHRFNLVASRDTYKYETRAYNMYASSNAWNTFLTKNSNKAFDYNSPTSVIYLGSSLASATSAAGADIPRISSDISMKDSYVYLFDSTWTATGVSPSAAWTPTSDYLKEVCNSTATTQAANPANYKGWSTERYLDLLSYEEGDDLYTSASKTERVITSYAGSWQGYMLNDALIPTVGWRYDSVKTRSVNAVKDTASNNSHLKLDQANYSLPDWDSTKINYYKSHSLSGGAVVHINNLLPAFLEKRIPLNVSLSYNDSSNFQVTSARVDVYGSPISNPAGKTKEVGVVLSTKDDRISFRVIKYTTSVKNATVSTLSSFSSAINYGLNFRNVFLYKLTSYTLAQKDRATANATGGTAVFNGETVTYGTRWWWTPAYVDANGRPVESVYWSLYSGRTAPTSYDHLETWAEATKHRDDCITAWNDIQTWLTDKGYFKAWNYSPTTLSCLTTRSIYESTATVNATTGILENSKYDAAGSTVYQYGGSVPSGYAITADSESKGYEFELSANITKNWRLAFNASKTSAIYTSVGGDALNELVDYMDVQMNGVAGDMRRWNGDFQDGNEVRDSWADFRSAWTLVKLQEKTDASELRKWRYNIVTNYTFDNGWLKGFSVGAAYRWQDKVVIGYPVYTDTNGYAAYNLDKPVYGPTEDGKDFWISYERPINDKINWKIQLNIRNAFDSDGLIPITVEPDGTTWAGVRLKPVQEWYLTNTFTF